MLQPPLTTAAACGVFPNEQQQHSRASRCPPLCRFGGFCICWWRAWSVSFRRAQARMQLKDFEVSTGGSALRDAHAATPRLPAINI